MSKTLKTIRDTGRNKTDMTISEFYGGEKNGSMMQVTQGFGRDIDEPGFIQLTKKDAEKLIETISKWINI